MFGINQYTAKVSNTKYFGKRMGNKAQKRFNKSKELWFLKNFLERMNILPSDIFEREKPDFQIDLNNQKIGIEITEFAIVEGCKVVSEHRQEDCRKKIQEIVNEKMNAGVIDQRRVEVSFNEINMPHKHLATILMNAFPDDLDYEGYVDISSSLAKSLFNYVYFKKVLPEESGLFYSQVHNWQPSLDVKRLREIIMRKEKKAEGYEKFDENWLIVAFDRTEPAHDQCLDMSLESLSNIVLDNFDRIFLYRTYESDPVMIARNGMVTKFNNNNYVL